MPPAPAPVRSRSLWRWVAPVLGAWAVVALLHLLWLLLIELWLIGLMIVALGWAVALAVTATASVRLWRPRRGAAIGVLVAGLAAAVIVVWMPWTSLYARLAFTADRAAFAEIAERVDRGEFEETPYYGTPVGRLRLLGDASVVRLEAGPDSRVVLVQVHAGIPDGGAGFGYVTGGPPGTYDCFGDACRARASFGDGWYWFSP